MKARDYLAVSAVAGAIGVAAFAQTPTRAVLSIPGMLAALPATEVAELPHGQIEELTVALNQPRTAVRPGSLSVVVNGTVVNATAIDRGDQRGIVARVVLTGANARFEAGLNTVEVSYDRPYVGRVSTHFLLQIGSSGKRGAASGRPGARHAVVIGIAHQKFAGDGLQNLAYADRDAATMQDVLTSPAGGNVVASPACILLNEDATLEKLRAAFKTCLGGSRAGDQVVVFFAGQVMPDPMSPKDLFVVAYDSRPGQFDTTALPLQELEALYSKTLAGRVAVTFLDAGRRREEGGLPFQHTTRANDLWLRYATAAGGAAFAAASPSEISYERADLDGGHGLFGFVLSRGLKGAADANVDGTVLMGELADYVRTEYAARNDGASKVRQTPVVALNKLDNLAIAGREPGAGTNR